MTQRSSRHADELGQRRGRVFSTPGNGRFQTVGRGAKRPINHAILIDLAGGCRNQRSARARRHHPDDHVQMIDLVRSMRNKARLAAGSEHRVMKHRHSFARRQDEGFVRQGRQLEARSRGEVVRWW